MLAVSAAAARVLPRVPSCARRLGRDGSCSRGAPRTIARGARDNPNFDPNDPMTWGTQQGDDDAFMDMGVPTEDLMQLSDEQLGQLLGMADHLTFALAAHGLKAYKYMPYGPVREVVPYLLRRAHENADVLSGASEQRDMMLAEVRRRWVGV